MVADVPSIAFETISSTVRCAEIIGATVVAEWVESERVRDALHELGVTWGQGFLLGDPKPLGQALTEHPLPAPPG